MSWETQWNLVAPDVPETLQPDKQPETPVLPVTGHRDKSKIQTTFCIKCLIDRTVLFLAESICICSHVFCPFPLPILCFILFLFILWFCYQTEEAIVIFTAFFSFKLYAIMVWQTISYSHNFIFATLLKVLCTFAFPFQVEEFTPTSLIRQVCWS